MPGFGFGFGVGFGLSWCLLNLRSFLLLNDQNRSDAAFLRKQSGATKKSWSRQKSPSDTTFSKKRYYILKVLEFSCDNFYGWMTKIGAMLFFSESNVARQKNRGPGAKISELHNFFEKSILPLKSLRIFLRSFLLLNDQNRSDSVISGKVGPRRENSDLFLIGKSADDNIFF